MASACTLVAITTIALAISLCQCRILGSDQAIALGKLESVPRGAALSDAVKYWRPEGQYTDSPVIGMLTQPTTRNIAAFGKSSYATSDCRWIQAGGARVVPVFYDSTKEVLDFLLPRLNGVVWTGGRVSFNPGEQDPDELLYLETTKYIFEYVVSENKKGNYYPLWGTCLGYERFTQLFADEKNGSKLLVDVDAVKYPINLGLTEEGWSGRMFQGVGFTREMLQVAAASDSHIMYHNHELGFDPELLRKSKASEHLRILSVDKDRSGKPFVSTVEGKRLPFYGVQWHPEKAAWEWLPVYHVNHSVHAVAMSNHLGRFFVEECKYNRNQFEPELLLQWLVVNFQTLASETNDFSSPYTEETFFPSLQQFLQTFRLPGEGEGHSQS